MNHLEQLPVGDEPVIVDVVDPEGKPQLLLLLSLTAELGHSLDKLLEVDLATIIIIKNIYEPMPLVLSDSELEIG